MLARAWRNGRRMGLKLPWRKPVRVQVPPPAPVSDDAFSRRSFDRQSDATKSRTSSHAPMPDITQPAPHATRDAWLTSRRNCLIVATAQGGHVAHDHRKSKRRCTGSSLPAARRVLYHHARTRANLFCRHSDYSASRFVANPNRRRFKQPPWFPRCSVNFANKFDYRRSRWHSAFTFVFGGELDRPVAHRNSATPTYPCRRHLS